jgi:hypothetical protein
MIFGKLTVHADYVETHRKDYMLYEISVVSVDLPLLAPACMLALGLGGFGFAFADLLYAPEIMACMLIAVGLVMVGTQLGRLTLLSRDLRGSELGNAVWGLRFSLNAKRRAITRALHMARNGGLS